MLVASSLDSRDSFFVITTSFYGSLVVMLGQSSSDVPSTLSAWDFNVVLSVASDLPLDFSFHAFHTLASLSRFSSLVVFSAVTQTSLSSERVGRFGSSHAESVESL